MKLHTIIVLAIGTGVMLLPILILMKRYNTDLKKSVPVAVILTVTGTLATYIWFLIENLWFGGRSFYGAVFLVPIAFIYVAKWLHIPHGDLMDFCAPAECVMLAIMKYQCLKDGCCGGRVLYTSAEGIEVIFPSQIVELGNALLVFLILMVLAWNKNNRGKIFAWYMIIYGASRFVLNFFRAETESYAFGLPAGNFWSVVAIVTGILWLRHIKRILRKKQVCSQETDTFPFGEGGRA